MPAEAIAIDTGPHPRSWLMFVFTALGMNAVLLPLVALAAMAVVLLMIAKGKGPAMVGAILLVVPAPICWSLLGMVSGLLSSFSVLALAEAEVKQQDIFAGLAEVLINVQTAAVLSIPVFVTAIGGFIYRALNDTAAPIQDWKGKK